MLIEGYPPRTFFISRRDVFVVMQIMNLARLENQE